MCLLKKLGLYIDDYSNNIDVFALIIILVVTGKGFLIYNPTVIIWAYPIISGKQNEYDNEWHHTL